MDGEAVEDNECWCPGVVCKKDPPPPQASTAASQGEAQGGAQAAAAVGENASVGQGGDGSGESPALVVHVLGQSDAEFAVNKENLTSFPGYGDNLETVQHSVATGLVSFWQ